MAKKVLIAEDQPDSRRLLEDIMVRFHPFGVETFIARNGTEALELAQKEQPDLLLLDIMMPGMNGFEVCRHVKSTPELANAYVIIVSAKIQQEDRKEAAQAGADEYLTKPYDINAMIERIQAALGVTLL